MDFFIIQNFYWPIGRDGGGVKQTPVFPKWRENENAFAKYSQDENRAGAIERLSSRSHVLLRHSVRVCSTVLHCIGTIFSISVRLDNPLFFYISSLQNKSSFNDAKIMRERSVCPDAATRLWTGWERLTKCSELLLMMLYYYWTDRWIQTCPPVEILVVDDDTLSDGGELQAVSVAVCRSLAGIHVHGALGPGAERTHTHATCKINQYKYFHNKLHDYGTACFDSSSMTTTSGCSLTHKIIQLTLVRRLFSRRCSQLQRAR